MKKNVEKLNVLKDVIDSVMNGCLHYHMETILIDDFKDELKQGGWTDDELVKSPNYSKSDLFYLIRDILNDTYDLYLD